jgi:hypothetical protein
MPEDPEHVATYAAAAIYFTFVFGSTPLSPHAFAEWLLAAEIVETVYSPVVSEVRVSPRYEGLVNHPLPSNWRTVVVERRSCLASRGLGSR